MANLKLKVPPPAYFLLGGSLIYLASRRHQAQPHWRWLGLPVFGVGLGLGLNAIGAFKARQTTLNPVHPERASQFVTAGAYRFSRNPMYLGMALMLSGWSLLWTSLGGLLVVPAFVAVLTRLQIIPEEEQLKKTFGAPYQAYLQQVRRWL